MESNELKILINSLEDRLKFESMCMIDMIDAFKTLFTLQRSYISKLESELTEKKAA